MRQKEAFGRKQYLVLNIDARGGGTGGAAAPLGLKNFRSNTVFRANASCSKSWM